MRPIQGFGALAVAAASWAAVGQPGSGVPAGRPPQAAAAATDLIDRARNAWAKVKHVEYSATVESYAGERVTGQYTAHVVLERNGKVWKMAVDAQLKSTAASVDAKPRVIKVAYDGTTARAINMAQKQFIEMPTSAWEDVSSFFVDQLANRAVLWELLTEKPLALPEDAVVTKEAPVTLGGDTLDVVRVELKGKDKLAGADASDSFGGRYFIGADGVVRKVERLRPNVTGRTDAASKPLRVVTLDAVQTSDTQKPEQFVLAKPEGFTVKNDKPKPALAPMEQSKKDVTKPASGDDEYTKDLLAVGTEAPAFKLRTGDNAPVSLADYKGKVVVTDFWATWCGPCKAAIPSLQKVAEKYKDKVVVLGMLTDDDTAQAKKIMKEKGASYTLVAQASGTSQRYKVGPIPCLYIIDANGKVAGRHVGYTPELEAELGKMIDPLLKP